jgi:D-glycero-D-manno-heptose 1,7-bisphosphate phosphatase
MSGLSWKLTGMRPRSYVLLDRDGTLIVEKNYLASVDQVELIPGAAEGMRLLGEAGFGLIVVTNQSGIARGKLTLDTLAAVHAEIESRLGREGVRLAAFYFCPHGPADGCECRKPKTFMVRRAAADFGFDLGECIVIGDKPADVELGVNCGARTILVRTGYGRESEAAGTRADFVANDLLEAARYLVGEQPATR